MLSEATKRAAVARLAEDGFVAYPTETVWGLGACADRSAAVERLLRWKGRGRQAPMSVLVESAEEALEWGCRFGPAAARLSEAFWPGPLTLVVRCDRRFAEGVAGPGGALGLRSTPHPVARALVCAVREAGLGPLTATSFNRSGRPAAADREAARALLAASASDDLESPLFVDDPEHDAGGEVPSSVVDCSGEAPEVLRPGAIDAERLAAVWSAGAPNLDSGSPIR